MACAVHPTQDTQEDQQPAWIDEIVHDHLPALRRYLASLGVHVDLIDDLAQDVFMQVILSLERYDETRPFRSWLFGIARNMVKKEFSKAKRDARVRSGLTTQLLADHRIAVNAQAHALASQQAREALTRCLGKLPERTRRVLLLRFEGRGKSHEIAADLDMTSTAVRSVLMRSLYALRQCIETRLTETQIAKALA